MSALKKHPGNTPKYIFYKWNNYLLHYALTFDITLCPKCVYCNNINRNINNYKCANNLPVSCERNCIQSVQKALENVILFHSTFLTIKIIYC